MAAPWIRAGWHGAKALVLGHFRSGWLFWWTLVDVAYQVMRGDEMPEMRQRDWQCIAVQIMLSLLFTLIFPWFELGKAVTFTLNPPVLLKNSHPEVFEELLREEYAVLFGGLSSIHRGAEEREEILSNVSVVWGWSVLGAIVLEPPPWQQSDCDNGDDDADNDGCDDGNENVGGYVAFTLGRTIIMSASVAREDLDEEVVRHELTHVCQFEGWCGGELGFLSDYFAQMTVEYLRTRNADHSYRSIMQERQAYALESTNAPKKQRRTSYRPRRKHCEITQVSIPTSRSSIRRSKRLASLSAPSL